MMADPTYQYGNHPHRKPLPRIQPDQQFPSSTNSNVYSHSRTRTTSSNTFPVPAPQNQYPGNTMYQGTFTSRRTPSTNTFSTTASSGNGPVPNRQPSTDLRRSTSSRSGGAPTSYVALMRKQKATVWCDRAQHEDPRLLAAQRAAKIRAANEVMIGNATIGGRTSTSGSGTMSSTTRVAAKIRHHGKSGLTGYTPAENFGVGVGGVPMRLSASEVEGGDSDDESESTGGGRYHHRSGSGRSSVGSAGARRGMQYRQSGASGNSGRWSSGHTPPSEREVSRVDSLTDLAEETPVPNGHVRAKDYFSVSGNRNSAGNRSTGSGSSGERADGLGELGGGVEGGAARLASNSLLKSTITREKSTKNPDELRRRGSVDDRTMTMSAGRLFVANPDVDSD